MISEVLTSEAYLITSKHSKHPELVELIRKRIVGYITACRLIDMMTTLVVDVEVEVIEVGGALLLSSSFDGYECPFFSHVSSHACTYIYMSMYDDD